MLPNVAAMFDRMTAEMVRVRILYSLATAHSIAWLGTMNQRFAVVDGFLNCPLDSSVEIRKNAPIGVIRSISRTFKMQNSKFANFLASCTRVSDHNCDEVFYVYADAIQRQNYKMPKTLDDAYGDGFLVIETASPGMYCLTIGNTIHENSQIWELEQILFNWSLSEGYIWS